MRAAFLESYGDPDDVVHVGEVDDPPVGPDSILIDVAAAGVNPVDWKVVAGYLQGAFASHFPLIPGWDVAGTVVAVGPAVTGVTVGDRVAAYDREDHIQWGTFAERVAAPQRTVAVIPDGVDVVQAAALPLAGLTAAQMLAAAGLGSSDVVLVHAAAGGVGSFACQLAELAGARVLGTASAAGQEYLREQGIEPIDYTADVTAQVRQAAPDGVTVVLDLVGGDTLAAAVDVLAPGGRVVSIADADGIAALRDQGIAAHYVFVHPDSEMLLGLLQQVATGELTVPIARTYPLEAAAHALTDSKSGRTRGKLVVTVASADPER